jgi:hypothetical protein
LFALFDGNPASPEAAGNTADVGLVGVLLTIGDPFLSNNVPSRDTDVGALLRRVDRSKRAIRLRFYYSGNAHRYTMMTV